MTYIAAAIVIGTLAYAVSQCWLIRQLRQLYATPQPEWPSDQPWPKVAIIVCLRGGDPFLESCLRNLLNQDYPDFMLQIIVDSESDPAWNAIRLVQSDDRDQKLNVTVLNNRRPSCSLKNSAIIQAISGLPSDCEVVGFVDADAITHPTWLRELVTPLSDPSVGCTTGIRWFAPTDRSFGTRMRCYWNLCAASVIYYSDTAWGGSMIVRRSVLESGLSEEWSRMFCEDAHTINFLRLRGLKLASVPQATLVNRESTSVSGCVNFVNRQMLIYRLYHRHWPLVVGMISSVALMRFTHYLSILVAMFYGEWGIGLLLIAMRPLSMFVIRHEAAHLDQAVRKMVGKTGEVVAENPIPDFLGYTCAELLFLTSMIYALGTRFVSWRGIKYKVNGPTDITMLAYQPYLPNLAATGARHSTIV